jgi:hypothetical protein
MPIHRTQRITSLYDRSQLLVSDEVVVRFYQFLRRQPQQQLRQSQLDDPRWHSKLLTLDHFGMHEEEFNQAIATQWFREPIVHFAFEVYMDFFRQNNVSLAEQIQQQLFSGKFSKHCYRITGNNFPYHCQNAIEHSVIWFNPNASFSDADIQKKIYDIVGAIERQGYCCMVFENSVENRSVPEVVHFQLFTIPVK